MTQNSERGRPNADPVLSVRSEASADQAIQRLLDQPLLPDDLREATERVARPLQPPEKEILRLLAFQLSGERFAVEARSVAKVTYAVGIHRIPHRSNAVIRGFCHVDGDLLLCADLGNLLELEPANPPEPKQAGRGRCRQPTANDRARVSGTTWGIEVEAVDGVIPVVPDELADASVDGRCAARPLHGTCHRAAEPALRHTRLASRSKWFSGGIVMSDDLSGFSLFELFKLEAQSHSAVLSDGLLAIESQPDDLSHVEGLMRAAHSIKGAARIIDLDAIVELAHAMEDCFVGVQRGAEKLTSARVDQLLQGVDLIQSLAELSEQQLADWTAQQAAQCEQLAQQLRQQPPAAQETPSRSARFRRGGSRG